MRLGRVVGFLADFRQPSEVADYLHEGFAVLPVHPCGDPEDLPQRYLPDDVCEDDVITITDEHGDSRHGFSLRIALRVDANAIVRNANDRGPVGDQLLSQGGDGRIDAFTVFVAGFDDEDSDQFNLLDEARDVDAGLGEGVIRSSVKFRQSVVDEETGQVHIDLWLRDLEVQHLIDWQIRGIFLEVLLRHGG